MFHNESGIDKDDEGYVQTFEVETKNLAKFEHVFVSVWAVNHVSALLWTIQCVIQVWLWVNTIKR